MTEAPDPGVETAEPAVTAPEEDDKLGGGGDGSGAGGGDAEEAPTEPKRGAAYNSTQQLVVFRVCVEDPLHFARCLFDNCSAQVVHAFYYYGPKGSSHLATISPLLKIRFKNSTDRTTALRFVSSTAGLAACAAMRITPLQVAADLPAEARRRMDCAWTTDATAALNSCTVLNRMATYVVTMTAATLADASLQHKRAALIHKLVRVYIKRGPNPASYTTQSAGFSLALGAISIPGAVQAPPTANYNVEKRYTAYSKLCTAQLSSNIWMQELSTAVRRVTLSRRAPDHDNPAAPPVDTNPQLASDHVPDYGADIVIIGLVPGSVNLHDLLTCLLNALVPQPRVTAATAAPALALTAMGVSPAWGTPAGPSQSVFVPLYLSCQSSEARTHVHRTLTGSVELHNALKTMVAIDCTHILLAAPLDSHEWLPTRNAHALTMLLEDEEVRRSADRLASPLVADTELQSKCPLVEAHLGSMWRAAALDCVDRLLGKRGAGDSGSHREGEASGHGSAARGAGPSSDTVHSSATGDSDDVDGTSSMSIDDGSFAVPDAGVDREVDGASQCELLLRSALQNRRMYDVVILALHLLHISDRTVAHFNPIIKILWTQNADAVAALLLPWAWVFRGLSSVPVGTLAYLYGSDVAASARELAKRSLDPWLQCATLALSQQLENAATSAFQEPHGWARTCRFVRGDLATWNADRSLKPPAPVSGLRAAVWDPVCEWIRSVDSNSLPAYLHSVQLHTLIAVSDLAAGEVSPAALRLWTSAKANTRKVVFVLKWGASVHPQGPNSPPTPNQPRGAHPGPSGSATVKQQRGARLTKSAAMWSLSYIKYNVGLHLDGVRDALLSAQAAAAWSLEPMLYPTTADCIATIPAAWSTLSMAHVTTDPWWQLALLSPWLLLPCYSLLAMLNAGVPAPGAVCDTLRSFIATPAPSTMDHYKASTAAPWDFRALAAPLAEAAAALAAPRPLPLLPALQCTGFTVTHWSTCYTAAVAWARRYPVTRPLRHSTAEHRLWSQPPR